MAVNGASLLLPLKGRLVKLLPASLKGGGNEGLTAQSYDMPFKEGGREGGTARGKEGRCGGGRVVSPKQLGPIYFGQKEAVTGERARGKSADISCCLECC